MTNTTVVSLLALLAWHVALAAAGEQAAPQGYRFADLKRSCRRTYGGYGWTEPDGTLCEEGITIEGSPLLCTPDTMLVVNAATAEVSDLHFHDGDIRRTWIESGGRGRSSALHLFTRLCPDPLVSSWGSYVPVLLRYRPGVLFEDVRRPGYTETFGAAHQVGALRYRTLRAKPSPVEVRQRWYVPARWCVVNQVEVRNLTDKADEAAAIGVAMNLRSPVTTDRNRLNWYADFHTNGKAGISKVPRLTDEEYRRLVKLTQFQVEYRPDEKCVVAQTGCDVRAEKPTDYFACLMLGAPVASHVLSAGGEAQQTKLFTGGARPKRLAGRRAVVGLRTEGFRLGPKGSHTLRFAIAFGKTGDEAVANARKGLAVGPAEAARKAQAFWTRRLPAFETGDAALNSMLRCAAITHDVNFEPDGRAPGDLGGWDRASRAEVCGYKNYYDQDDMVVPLLDVPVYDPELAKKALLYDVDPKTQRLRKLIVWRQQYDNMVYWPVGTYKVWMATRDEQFLRKIYPVLDNTLRWLRKTRTGPDGLLRMLTMPYDIFTIGLGDDRPVLIRAQAVAFEAFQAMRHMARHLKKPDDAAFYQRWADQVKKAANQKLWRGSFYSFSLDFRDHFCLSGNCCAITAGLCNAKQAQAICRQIALLDTGTGFPGLHPPVPAWVGAQPYSYQNGDQYVDQLPLIARAANKAGDADLLARTFRQYRRILWRWKCFPVTIHPWNANHRGGVNEIHSASGLIACLVYGAAGVAEGEDLRFRPMMIPELGGRVEIRGLLYRGTRFDIRLEGRGRQVQAVQIDGKAVSGPAVPRKYCDGKKHTVILRVQQP